MIHKAEFYNDLQYNDEKVAVKVMMETASSKEIRILFKEGQCMQKHQTNFPITVHVLKGEIEFGVNSEKHHLNEGDIIALNAKVPHDLSAVKQSVVRLSLNKADRVERILKVVGK